MQTLKSIQTADRLYNTGDRPVLVMCSDMQDYVCFDKTCCGSKHSRNYQELTHFTVKPDLKKQKGYLEN